MPEPSTASYLGAVWAQPQTRFGVVMQLGAAVCAIGFGVYLRATSASRGVTHTDGSRSITLSAYEQGVLIVIFAIAIAGGISIVSGMFRAARPARTPGGAR